MINVELTSSRLLLTLSLKDSIDASVRSLGAKRVDCSADIEMTFSFESDCCQLSGWER